MKVLYFVVFIVAFIGRSIGRSNVVELYYLRLRRGKRCTIHEGEGEFDGDDGGL